MRDFHVLQQQKIKMYVDVPPYILERGRGAGLLTSIDLFCGAGGLTEGFRQSGFDCLYGNDSNHFAVETFKLNHPNTIADLRPIEAVQPRSVRRKLSLKRGGKGYYVDWILARLDVQRRLQNFVAIEVQTIDTTGNYHAERKAYLEDQPSPGSPKGGINWENVNKRILPQLIYKGHVLRREQLCQFGLFFLCPTPVYKRIVARLGGRLEQYHYQPGTITFRWYNIDDRQSGVIAPLRSEGQYTTTVDQVAHAFTSPQNLPEAGVYQKAIEAVLQKKGRRKHNG